MKYKFVPQKDITSYELAYIMANVSSPMIFGILFTQTALDATPHDVRRHFVRVDDSDPGPYYFHPSLYK